MTERPTAIITGASKGLGRKLAGALAERGWRLIIDARGEEALREAEDELARSTKVMAIAGEIQQAKHRQELVDAARAFGPIRAIVNNAGALGPSPQPRLVEYPTDELERVLWTNVVAPLALIQQAREFLAPEARILNITSDAAVEAYPTWGGYGASKAALEQWTAILAAEEPELFVYAVDPGDMRTDMHQRAFPGEDISGRPTPAESVPGLLELIEAKHPSGRYRARDLA
jgi:NAD(P)-dependent dehydrogenase (short-subunit alcohol dehydrogenase family)